MPRPAPPLLALAFALAACGPAATGPAPGRPPSDPCERLVACNAAIGATLCAKVPNPDNCRAAFTLHIAGFDALTCQQVLRSLTDTLAPFQPGARGWKLPEVCR